jgi:hypothetical protein
MPTLLLHLLLLAVLRSVHLTLKALARRKKTIADSQSAADVWTGQTIWRKELGPRFQYLRVLENLSHIYNHRHAQTMPTR